MTLKPAMNIAKVVQFQGLVQIGLEPLLIFQMEMLR
jgi:hypothetical protein